MVRESNMIEGIHREPTKAEMEEYHRFMHLEVVTVQDMIDFVKVYQPNARIRDRLGLDVRVGSYEPPVGRPDIRKILEHILELAQEPKFNLRKRTPFQTHCAYESLHPFTDGNGRSGRMLWMWMMGDGNAPLGFLHTFYYQSLDDHHP